MHGSDPDTSSNANHATWFFPIGTADIGRFAERSEDCRNIITYIKL
jgi:hypothetical protein